MMSSRNATNRIRLGRSVPQQKFNDDVVSLSLRHRHRFLKLDGRARFDHMAIVRPYCFGNIVRMNVKVRFPADLVAPHLMAAFIFAIHQNVAEIEILNENDGRRVIQNILQPLVASAKCLFCPLAFANLG